MQRTKEKFVSAILVSILVLIALTSTAWTKKLFGRGTEEEISFSQLPFLDQLNSLVGGQEHEVKAMIRGENVPEFLTMKLVNWTKAKVTPQCCKTQSQRKYMPPSS